MLAHPAVIPIGTPNRAGGSLPALLADESSIEMLQPYMNQSADELASIGAVLSTADLFELAGQGCGLAALPSSKGDVMRPGDGLDVVPPPPGADVPAPRPHPLEGFLARIDLVNPAPTPATGPVAPAGMPAGHPLWPPSPGAGQGDATSGWTVATAGSWDREVQAFPASMQDGLAGEGLSGTWSADRTSGHASSPATWGDAGGPAAGIQAPGPALADLGPLFAQTGEGLAGLFSASPGDPSVTFASPFDLTCALDGYTAGPRGGPLPEEETRPGIAPRPPDSAGGSTTAEAEAIADLTSRLVLAVERLEQAAGRLASRGPLPLASAPRPFPGRVDA